MSWTHWDRSQEARDFLEFVRALFAIRRANPVLRRRTFLAGKRPEGTDVLWLRPDGQELDNGDWTNGLRTMAMLLDGNGILESDPEGRQIAGASLFVVFNGAEAAVECRLPGGDGTWTRLKACRSDTCQWAFVDQARNRSRQWCDMRVCGNRQKVRTFRSRHA